MDEEVEIKRLRRTLAASKSWVTRCHNTLDALVGDTEPDVAALERASNELEKRLDAFDRAQGELELCVPDEEMEQCITDASDFRDVPLSAVLQARKLISDSNSENGSAVGRSSGSGERKLNVKLPQLDLPKFDGALVHWQTFWDKFKALIGETELSPVTKFSYLASLLEGEAKQVIQGLSVTGRNYEVACELLEQRYGRPERIVFAHIQALLSLQSAPAVQKGTSRVVSLWQLQDTLLSHVRSLEALGIKGETYGLFLTPVILSKLPSDIRLEWAREGEGKEADLQFLLDFLRKEIQRRERSETFRENNTQSSQLPEQRSFSTRNNKKLASASALHVSSSPSHLTCVFCERTHPSHKCRKVARREDRHYQIKTRGLCFRCLDPSHRAQSCPKLCSVCGGRHHAVLCEQNCAPSTSSTTSTNDIAASSSNHSETTSDHSSQPGSTVANLLSMKTFTGNAVTSQTYTALPIVEVLVQRPGQAAVKARMLFDTGSDKTYVSSTLLKTVRPQHVGVDSVRYAAFGGAKAPQSDVKNVYALNVKGTRKGNGTLIAVEVPTICAPMYRPTIPLSKLAFCGRVDLVDTGVKDGESVTIDILVGLDQYWKYVTGGVLIGVEGLVAQETTFGWMISGSWESTSISVKRSVTQLLCVHDISEHTIRNFWDLESIGISPKEVVDPPTVVDPVLSQFNESVKWVDGRYEVSLPWNSKRGDLLNNEVLARKRLSSLSRRFEANPVLRQEYDTVLEEYESSGYIEEVVDNSPSHTSPTYYMPHHPVVKASSVSTKVRLVFDASAAGFNGVSLNDCVEAGPSLIPSLVEVLLRFRRWKVALSADIKRAFLQISVCKQDRDVHRFLWDHQGRVREMRVARVPFGNKASPFLLNATIQHHLASYTQTPVIQELSKNLYVDDWLTGADNEGVAAAMFNEAREVMNGAGMELTKWNSNSEMLQSKFCLDLGDKQTGTASVKVLGIGWRAQDDCFCFSDSESLIPNPEVMVCTKRAILSLIARIFDPLGFLTPLVMSAKFIFQELWCSGVGWDEEVPVTIQTRFVAWAAGLRSISQLQIPRCITKHNNWKEVSGKLEIHAFGDASKKGYGAVVYCRVPGGGGNSYQISLVMAKGKVAPLKSVTLPRLELLGALLCARLATFVLKALELSSSQVSVTCWTDSTIALGWIQGESSRWKPFVANRVREIQDLTSPSDWHHCPGVDNPADIISRGSSGSELATSLLWWKGPQWLASKITYGDTCDEVSDTCEEEAPNKDALVALNVQSREEAIPVSQCSTLGRALRITGWVLRFINNTRKKPRLTGILSCEELLEAKVKLFSLTQEAAYAQELHCLKGGIPLKKASSILQLKPFIGSDGLLRVGGRLHKSHLGYEEKHPVILPKGQLTLLLVRNQHQQHKHAGVDTMICLLRATYWIVSLRRLAKRVKRECVACRRQDTKACTQPCGPLPHDRVTEAPPFSVTGLDFAGPLFVHDLPGKKLYFLLFTCAVVRAVHMSSLTR